MSRPAQNLLIVLITFLAYQITLRNSFAYDDLLLIANNPFVWSWKNLRFLFSPAYITKISNVELIGLCPIGSGEITYRPVSTLFFFVLFRFFGLDPLGWHVASLLLRAANGILLCYFLTGVTRNRRAAYLAAIFFILHPVNAGVVNCVAHNEEMLAFCFLILSFILFIQENETERAFPAPMKRKLLRLASIGLFLLALLSKETALALVMLIVLYDYFFVYNQEIKALGRNFISRYSGYLLAMMIYLAIYLYMYLKTNVSLNNYHNLTRHNPFAFVYLIKNMGTCLYWLINPIRMYPLVPPTETDSNLSPWFDPGFHRALLWAALCLLMAVHWRKRSPVAAFSIVWFFTALVPVYPLLSINGLVSRYLYLPSVGFVLLLGTWFDQAWTHGKRRVFKGLTSGLFILILASYFSFTVFNSMLWKNNVTFWKAVVRSDPKNPMGHSNMAIYSLRLGQVPEAIKEVKLAMKLGRHRESSHYRQIGVCLYKMGRRTESERFFRKALKLNPNSVLLMNDLGCVYRDTHRLSKAVDYFNGAIRMCPYFIPAHKNLGSIYFRLGDTDKAKDAWLNALRIDPDDPVSKIWLKKIEMLK